MLAVVMTRGIVRTRLLRRRASRTVLSCFLTWLSLVRTGVVLGVLTSIARLFFRIRQVQPLAR